jgi:mitochondrial fission process protein 1
MGNHQSHDHHQPDNHQPDNHQPDNHQPDNHHYPNNHHQADDYQPDNNQLDDNNHNNDNYPAYLIIIIKSVQKVRLLAYTSEVGEAMRPIIPKSIVSGAYLISIGYIILDIFVKTTEMIPKQQNVPLEFCSLVCWHSLASLALPAIVIHRTVKITGGIQNKIMNKFPTKFPKIYSRYYRFFPTAIGLITIPFIIHPIDNLTDKIVDTSKEWIIDKYVQ